jgi:YidC/Oxa1 family membrane protein insertase
MEDQNKNLLLACALSLLVIIAWPFFFPPPEAPLLPEEAASTATPSVTNTPTATAAQPEVLSGTTQAVDVAQDAPRIPITTEELTGSISLLGGRIDDLKLNQYWETLDEDSDTVRLLTPVGQDNAYYALYGWAPVGGLEADEVPGPNTIWVQDGSGDLTVANPVTLTWTNANGIVFNREISVDEDFLFTVSQNVENTSDAVITLAPYGVIARHGEPDTIGFFILHEGMVRMSDGQLKELDYSDMPDLDINERERARADVIDVEANGWLGFTDKYWMTSLIPTPGTGFKSVTKYDAARDIYQLESVLNSETIAPGASTSVQTQLFAGAKEWEAIRSYQNEGGVEGFLDSIDWGWFYFLTKPIFAALHWLNAVIGNMGWAIIALTLGIKAILLPLAYKSYVSMARMKELQPEMEKLKEAAGDDKQKMQQGMIELYKKNKVNPASGCLPILMQIPIFFSLYKVIFVTLELRHAAWFGPFQDLSAPDPTSLLNFFGLLPWSGPEVGSIMALVFIGILPLLLGISMWMQQKLNPAPTDPTQQMIFAWMPWVFMFMLGGFASGLVVYWIANNTITFSQQYLIMRSQGIKPDVFGNIKSSFKRKPKADN